MEISFIELSLLFTDDTSYARLDANRNERHHGDALWALAVHNGGEMRGKRKRQVGVQASIV